MLALSRLSCGQDIHFTQLDVNPVLYNPAYCGFFDGTGRFGLAYRNQWATVSIPFQTIAATGEVSLSRSRYHRNGFNIGFVAYSDRAGSLSYGSTSGTLMLSYFKAFGRNSTLLSIGIEGGYGRTGYDISNAIFQDPGDELALYHVNIPTMGAGVALFVQPNDLYHIKFGFSAHNLNRPNISYMGLDDTYLERRYNFYGRAEYRAWPNVALQPLAACQLQKNNTEVLTGMDAKWFLNESANDYLTLSWGLHYRWLDALLLAFTIEYNSFVLALNYDANLSKLTPASYSVGAFEFQLIYRLINQGKISHKALPCPII